YKFDGFGVCNIDKGKEIVVANSVCSVANRKGKGKVIRNGFCMKGKSIDVSKPDDGFCGKFKNVDVFDVSKPNVKRPFRKNTSCKTGCLARMMVRKIEGGMFKVYGFVEEHNHPLVSREDMQFMNSSRDLGFLKQQFMLQVANSNVGPVRAFKFMKEVYGRFENVGATATDCKNLSGEEDSLCGLFWADKVARLNYQRMVFVPFTGIDNHNRSVTFGVGLLSDETISSYKWLLQSFKKAFVADPQVVITDQDASMKQAVKAEFPNARHRLLCNKSNFKARFCRIVWNERISIDIFEQEWASIMDEFDLGSHKWSEYENRHFNKFTNPDLTLVEFISHFKSAMDIQWYTQKKNDHESRYNRLEFQTDWQLEKDAAELFTLNISKKFKMQL
nr:hypothetical protein [Tanacetum cinerariifolium]